MIALALACALWMLVLLVIVLLGRLLEWYSNRRYSREVWDATDRIERHG